MPPRQSLREWPSSDNGQRPSPALFNYTTNASLVFGRRPSLASTGISDEGLSTAEADAAVAPDVGQAFGGRGFDPNIVRVADPLNPTNQNDPMQLPLKSDDSSAEGFNPIPSAKAPTPASKLRKNPSPGVPVVLPDRSTLVDPQSPTGLLMAPVADLGDVAAAGREAREKFRALAVTPGIARMYIAAALGMNVGHGGAFDYQRQGNKITGYIHLQQFEKVSNLNVGLFAQQAGLPLEQVLNIAGTFPRNFSNNSDPNKPYGLSDNQLELITLGYKIGEGGMFDKPPMP